MKTLLTVWCGLVVLSAQGMVTEMKAVTDSPVTKKGDTTIVEVAGTRVVIIEGEDKDDVDVRIEDSETGEEKDLDENGLFGDKKDKDKKELKNVKTRFLMFQLGINGYLNTDGTLDAPAAYPGLELRYGKSINVNFHLLRQRVNLFKHVVNLEYGLWFELNDYRFSKQVVPVADQPVFTMTATPEPVKKSKLSDCYLHIPLFLNFESNPYDKKKSFQLGLGAYGGLLLSARTKIKTTDGEKIKHFDDFNLNKFRYGLAAELGYGWFNIYATYAISDMFAKGQGPILTPVSVGLTLVGF